MEFLEVQQKVAGSQPLCRNSASNRPECAPDRRPVSTDGVTEYFAPAGHTPWGGLGVEGEASALPHAAHTELPSTHPRTAQGGRGGVRAAGAGAVPPRRAAGGGGRPALRRGGQRAGRGGLHAGRPGTGQGGGGDGGPRRRGPLNYQPFPQRLPTAACCGPQCSAGATPATVWRLLSDSSIHTRSAFSALPPSNVICTFTAFFLGPLCRMRLAAWRHCQPSTPVFLLRCGTLMGRRYFVYLLSKRFFRKI